MFPPSGVRAASGSVSGGGSAAHQCVWGSVGVSTSWSLQVAAAGTQPPGSPTARPPQRQPGRRPLRPEGRLKEETQPREKFDLSEYRTWCHQFELWRRWEDQRSDPDPGWTATQTEIIYKVFKQDWVFNLTNFFLWATLTTKIEAGCFRIIFFPLMGEFVMSPI